MLFFVGCDAAIPMSSVIDIPKSQFSIVLYNDDGDYYYGIFGEGVGYNSYGTRDLGPVGVDETAAPIIKEESPGVYRIVWGSGDKAAYVVIDVEKRLIVEDSNPDNERNQPLVLER